jgi:hypothetical protein
MPKFEIYEENGIKYKKEAGKIYVLNKEVWVLDMTKDPVFTKPKDLGFEISKIKSYNYPQLLTFKALFQTKKNKYYDEKKYLQYHEAAICFHTIYLEMMSRKYKD